jgi:hypothetical protein
MALGLVFGYFEDAPGAQIIVLSSAKDDYDKDDFDQKFLNFSGDFCYEVRIVILTSAKTNMIKTISIKTITFPNGFWIFITIANSFAHIFYMKRYMDRHVAPHCGLLRTKLLQYVDFSGQDYSN